MTHEESRPFLEIAAVALAERAKSPDGVPQAILIGARAFTALIDSHTEMLPEDKAIIPTILISALNQMRVDLHELSLDASRVTELLAASKVYAMTEAAVKTAIAHAQ